MRRVSHRARVVSGLAGFRGAVSLAAALAVPETVHSAAFPGRDMIVFVTADVLAVIPQLAATLGTDTDVVDRLQHEYERHRTVLDARGSDDEELALRHDTQYAALRPAVLRRKRDTIIRVRDQGRIDDSVLWQIQTSRAVRLPRHRPARPHPGPPGRHRAARPGGSSPTPPSTATAHSGGSSSR